MSYRALLVVTLLYCFVHYLSVIYEYIYIQYIVYLFVFLCIQWAGVCRGWTSIQRWHLQLPKVRSPCLCGQPRCKASTPWCVSGDREDVAMLNKSVWFNVSPSVTACLSWHYPWFLTHVTHMHGEHRWPSLLISSLLCSSSFLFFPLPSALLLFSPLLSSGVVSYLVEAAGSGEVIAWGPPYLCPISMLLGLRLQLSVQLDHAPVTGHSPPLCSALLWSTVWQDKCKDVLCRQALRCSCDASKEARISAEIRRELDVGRDLVIISVFLCHVYFFSILSPVPACVCHGPSPVTSNEWYAWISSSYCTSLEKAFFCVQWCYECPQIISCKSAVGQWLLTVSIQVANLGKKLSSTSDGFLVVE